MATPSYFGQPKTIAGYQPYNPNDEGRGSNYGPTLSGGARPQQQSAYTPSPMPDTRSWRPSTPTPTAGTPYQPQQSAYNVLPSDNTPQWWNSSDNRNAANNQMSTMLPYYQFQQNNTQYANDFNEAQRRYDQDLAWRQNTDTYNMELAGRQQGMAEWQANEAARQFGAQFGWQQTTDTWTRDLSQQAANTEQAYRQGLISNSQRELALGELTQQQNNALGQRNAEIEQAYRQGLISNSQRELALGELTQQQNNALGQGNLAWQRELGTGQLQLSRDEMIQRAALEREQMQNSQRLAQMQAYGRWQQPNVRWQRNY